MRFLAVPNWSIPATGSISGKTAEELLNEAKLAATGLGVRIHYWKYDLDHARAVTAFSGVAGQMEATIFAIADRLFPGVDLNLHEGVHPRVGILDVCPFVSLVPTEAEEQEKLAEIQRLVALSRGLAAEFSAHFRIPTRLYEYAAEQGRPHALPVLRSPKSALPPPDFGEVFVGRESNLKNGLSIFGVRDFLIAANINLDTDDPTLCRQISRSIRHKREFSEDSDFKGVRALGFELPNRGLTQVSLNITEPNVTSFDQIYLYVHEKVTQAIRDISGTELIGVIRRADLERSRLLEIEDDQIVDLD